MLYVKVWRSSLLVSLTDADLIFISIFYWTIRLLALFADHETSNFSSIVSFSAMIFMILHTPAKPIVQFHHIPHRQGDDLQPLSRPSPLRFLLLFASLGNFLFMSGPFPVPLTDHIRAHRSRLDLHCFEYLLLQWNNEWLEYVAERVLR